MVSALRPSPVGSCPAFGCSLRLLAVCHSMCPGIHEAAWVVTSSGVPAGQRHLPFSSPTPPLPQPGTELGEGPGGLLLTGLLQGVLGAAQEAAQAQRDRGVALLHAARRRAQPEHAGLQMDRGPAARADRAHAAGEAPALARGGDSLHGLSLQSELMISCLLTCLLMSAVCSSPSCADPRPHPQARLLCNGLPRL